MTLPTYTLSCEVGARQVAKKELFERSQRGASFGVYVDATNRPLNRYVQAVDSWRCPSDRGDANYGAKKLFSRIRKQLCHSAPGRFLANSACHADSDHPHGLAGRNDQG